MRILNSKSYSSTADSLSWSPSWDTKENDRESRESCKDLPKNVMRRYAKVVIAPTTRIGRGPNQENEGTCIIRKRSAAIMGRDHRHLLCVLRWRREVVLFTKIEYASKDPKDCNSLYSSSILPTGPFAFHAES